VCDVVKVMLLAAGEGRRMRPLTLTVPKPLLKVGESTLIERWIDACTGAGLKEFVINTWYLGDRIVEKLGNGDSRGVSISYSHEPVLLETGGGISHAMPLLGDEDFLVISTDVVCDYDLRNLPEALPEGVAAHLILVQNPEHHGEGDFSIEDSGRLGCGFNKSTYSGIGVYSPALFRDSPAGAFKLRLLMDKAMAEGTLSGELYDGFWLDVGTVERYEILQRHYKN
jgi:N-acetyl-alpha-D-muramate 1-phosphate uridylyltransferase